MTEIKNDQPGIKPEEKREEAYVPHPSDNIKRNIIIVAVFMVVVIIANFFWQKYFVKSKDEIINQIYQPNLTAAEARTIAEANCVKGGGSIDDYYFYNENSKTWWFDANLNATQPGCNPACVVSDEEGTAEINWRCTGLIEPRAATVETITELFKAKYPKYAATLKVTIVKEDEGHARGGVIFVPAAPGVNFLAAAVDGDWQIVYDGNGQISCDLYKYGFPQDMLSDCAE